MPWWATIPKDDWPASLEENIKPLYDDAGYGDRQQEFVVIGADMNAQEVETALKQCLLTDEEMEMSVEAWKTMVDPFRKAWDQHDHDHDHDHDHNHDHHHDNHGHDHAVQHAHNPGASCGDTMC